MKLVGHKCVGSAVTQAASYKPYDPQDLQGNTMADFFTKHLPFWLLAKNLKKRSFGARSTKSILENSGIF